MDAWEKAGLKPREALLMEATLTATADVLKEQNKRLAALEAGRGGKTRYLAHNPDGSVGPNYVEPVSKDQVSALIERVMQLESQVAALAAEKGIAYRGVWESGETYQAGDYTTDKGSLWCCLETTRSRPGTNGSWQLAVKNGKGGAR